MVPFIGLISRCLLGAVIVVCLYSHARAEQIGGATAGVKSFCITTRLRGAAEELVQSKSDLDERLVAALRELVRTKNIELQINGARHCARTRAEESVELNLYLYVHYQSLTSDGATTPIVVVNDMAVRPNHIFPPNYAPTIVAVIKGDSYIDQLVQTLTQHVEQTYLRAFVETSKKLRDQK